MNEELLVTHNLNDEQQRLIQELFKEDELAITFLSNVTDSKRADSISGADVILTLNPNKDFAENEFQYLNNTNFIQIVSAGADHLPYNKIPENIKLASNPGAYAEPMAEHVLAMALSLAKRLQIEDRKMRQGEFNQFSFNKSIGDSTIGILGFGGIGQAVANLFRPFGASISAMNTSGQTKQPTDFTGTVDDLKYILQSSDIIVLSLPLNNQTRSLIGKQQLKWMKEDAILINVARGEIIRQKDLYEHLKANLNFKAGLESWWVEPLRHGSFELEYPLLDLPNVLASPHNSSMVKGSTERGIAEAAKNIRRFINNQSIKGEINRANFV